MKTLTHLMLLAGLVGAPLAAAAEDSPHTLTGNVGLYSDYVFRGVSQTAEDPAIQGGFDYAHASGFYLGTWASNVETSDLNGANLEWDFYGGYSASAGDLGYNVGLLKYYYPGQNAGADFDTLELYGGVTYKGFGVKLSYNLDDYFGAADSDGTLYWDISYGANLPGGFALNLHYGITDADGAAIDYRDWKIGVSKEIAGVVLGLAYTDTNKTFNSAKNGKEIGDGRLLLSIGKTF